MDVEIQTITEVKQATECGMVTVRDSDCQRKPIVLCEAQTQTEPEEQASAPAVDKQTTSPSRVDSHCQTGDMQPREGPAQAL